MSTLKLMITLTIISILIVICNIIITRLDNNRVGNIKQSINIYESTYMLKTEYSNWSEHIFLEHVIKGNFKYLDSMKCIEYDNMKKQIQPLLNFKSCKK